MSNKVITFPTEERQKQIGLSDFWSTIEQTDIEITKELNIRVFENGNIIFKPNDKDEVIRAIEGLELPMALKIFQLTAEVIKLKMEIAKLRK